MKKISLIDSTCFEPNRIKVAFGGTVVIEKQPVEFPRVRDDRYRELEKLVRGKDTRAQVDVTLVGRFRRLSTLSPPHLFVIERVLSVTPR